MARGLMSLVRWASRRAMERRLRELDVLDAFLAMCEVVRSDPDTVSEVQGRRDRIVGWFADRGLARGVVDYVSRPVVIREGEPHRSPWPRGAELPRGWWRDEEWRTAVATMAREVGRGGVVRG